MTTIEHDTDAPVIFPVISAYEVVYVSNDVEDDADYLLADGRAAHFWGHEELDQVTEERVSLYLEDAQRIARKYNYTTNLSKGRFQVMALDAGKSAVALMG